MHILVNESNVLKIFVYFLHTFYNIFGYSQFNVEWRQERFSRLLKHEQQCLIH